MSYASQLYDHREDYQSWYPPGAVSSDDYTSSDANRVRLKSGSYSNSSGSTTDSKKSKRRSHRPRGCRGGGARRARKALREQARAREAMQDSAHHTKQADFPPKYVTSVEEQDIGLYKHQPHPYDPRAPSPAPSLQPCMSTLSNDSTASSGDLFNIFPPASHTAMNPHQYADSHGHAHRRVPYGQMTFTERGKSTSVGSLATNDPHPTTTATLGGGFVNVLPPLPVEEAEQEPETLEGPNPYSLKSNLRPDVQAYEPSVSSTLRPDADLYDPSSFETCSSNICDAPESTTTTTTTNSDDHRALIERQLNMGADSLFVTSPRSFLTGRKGF